MFFFLGGSNLSLRAEVVSGQWYFFCFNFHLLATCISFRMNCLCISPFPFWGVCPFSYQLCQLLAPMRINNHVPAIGIKSFQWLSFECVHVSPYRNFLPAHAHGYMHMHTRTCVFSPKHISISFLGFSFPVFLKMTPAPPTPLPQLFCASAFINQHMPYYLSL